MRTWFLYNICQAYSNNNEKLYGLNEVPVQLCRMHVFVSVSEPKHGRAGHLRLRTVTAYPHEALQADHGVQERKPDSTAK